MYNQKVHSVFQNLEKEFRDVIVETESFMENISEWADGLVGIVEKEVAAGKDSALFLLPKTPGQMKTRRKKGRNALVSKCSVINSTILNNETNTLNETISSRTRSGRKGATSKVSKLDITKDILEMHTENAMDSESNTLDESVSSRTRNGRRGATSKISKLNVTKDVLEMHPENAKQGTSVVEENAKGEISEVTFVMPKASTRTKPVLKNKKQEVTAEESKTPEAEKIERRTLNKSSESSEQESPPKKVSRTGRTSSERQSRRTMSRTPVGSSAEDLERTPIIVTETPVQASGRRKVSRTLSGSPVERQSTRKMFRNLSGSPVVRSSSVVVPRSSSGSPVVRSSTKRSSRTAGSGSNIYNSRSNSRSNVLSVQNVEVNTPEVRGSLGNRTVTIKKESTPIAASTFVVMDETVDEGERTPVVKVERFFRLSKTSTPAIAAEKTRQRNTETSENLATNAETKEVEESITNESLTPKAAEEVSQDAEIPKKKRKLKKDEEVKENIQEMAETMRITRTKSKAIKQMMEENETKQADLSAFAKKLLNKAKMTSVKKNQLAALLECNSSTPTNGPGLGNNLPFGNLTSSKSKYHLLLSSSKKLKTPLATLPNSALKIAKASADKDRIKARVASRDSSTENTVRSGAKPPKNDLEKEIKLRSKKEKEEEAALKRQNVIKSKQEELRRKNELKHQMAMKQREKLEQEKYHNMIQSEKEKEERHKLILLERQNKLKEEAFKKKMLTQQKIAETVERRRMEEAARIAKLKEMEAEEQRLALEKQKEQERQEKRAQERLAQKKAREEYEMQLKQELEAERLKAEKLLTAKKCMPSASKMQSASKRQKFGLLGERREWDYKPRNENDYGLEDEHSEVDSEDEKSYNKAKPAVPWGKKILHGKSPTVKVLTLEMLCEFMPCYQKSPDIHKMFRMTPSKRIKRTSSAIWNTPSS